MKLFFRVRKASIPKGERNLFERFGANAIGGVLAGGFNPRAEEFQPIYNDAAVRARALAWMTEEHDRTAQGELDVRDGGGHHGACSRGSDSVDSRLGIP